MDGASTKPFKTLAIQRPPNDQVCEQPDMSNAPVNRSIDKLTT
jgi:hypothetical protein